MKKKVMSGIILFNPDVGRLEENIASVISQVEQMFIVDNCSSNRDEIEILTLKINKMHPDKIAIEYNNQNYGIAFALNQILQFAEKERYDWFLTLDQDSICSDKLIDKYLQVANESLGQITCTIMDKNIGILDKIDSFNSGVIDVPFCITSGALNNTNALIKCGGFLNELFIDGVDLDISCNLRKHGYKIVQIDYEGLMHELGESKIFSFLGIKLKVTNHRPWRNYYIRRNLIFVARKYFQGYEKVRMILKQLIYGVGTVLMEDNKWERLVNNFKGIYDGFRMKI